MSKSQKTKPFAFLYAYKFENLNPYLPKAWILFIFEVWVGNCDQSIDVEFLKLLVLKEILIMNMRM